MTWSEFISSLRKGSIRHRSSPDQAETTNNPEPSPPLYPDIQAEGEDEDDESQDEPVEEQLPRFLLVEMDSINTLLQRCFKCGRLPGGKNEGKPRPITWSRSGTCLTASYRCSCSGNSRIRWSAQGQIGEGHKGAKMGNVAVAAASQVTY